MPFLRRLIMHTEIHKTSVILQIIQLRAWNGIKWKENTTTGNRPRIFNVLPRPLPSMLCYNDCHRSNTTISYKLSMVYSLHTYLTHPSKCIISKLNTFNTVLFDLSHSPPLIERGFANSIEPSGQTFLDMGHWGDINLDSIRYCTSFFFVCSCHWN